MSKYVVSDLLGFATNIRESVANSFSDNYSENLDDFITINQVILVIKEHSANDRDQIIINEESFNDIFDSVRVWIYESALAKLAANGFVECAWNSDINEFEFWIAEKNNEQYK